MAATPTVADSQSFPWLRDEPDHANPTSERVALSFEYPVHLTSDAFSWENLTLVRTLTRDARRRIRVLVVAERAVVDAHPCLLDDAVRYAEFHRERLSLSSEPLIVDGGARAKRKETLCELQTTFDALDPQSFVLIVGGGALQDVAGYAAATVHRAPRVVRLPTTVLAQATAPVAVRSGFRGFGCLAPPFAVIDDYDFLSSLGTRDTIAGVAEGVRVALSEDAALFDWLQQHAAALRGCEQAIVRELLRRVVTHHLSRGANIFDRAPLLGRWAAHKLEVITDHELRYGEALAIGCALDAAHSAVRGAIAETTLDSILATLHALGLPTYHSALDLEDGGRRVVLDALGSATILDAVGCGSEAHDLEPGPMSRALDLLRARS